MTCGVQFSQTVKVRAIALQTSNVAQGPRKIRLIINRPSLSFDDVEDDASVVQEIDLSEEDVREGRKVPLRFVRFQSVNSLHVSAIVCVKAGRTVRLAHTLYNEDSYTEVKLAIQIFVVSNQGGEDETRIDAIEVFGTPLMYVHREFWISVTTAHMRTLDAGVRET